MPSAFDALTAAQQADFQQQMTRLGFAANALSHQGVLDTGQREGPTILSTSPAESHVPPKLIAVQNIAEYKRLFGVPDTHYTEGSFSDRALRYPAPLVHPRAHELARITDVVELGQNMTIEEIEDLRWASEAFVLGNSAKVKSYEALLNTFFFPGHVAAFAFDAVVVEAGKPLVLQSPDPNGSITMNAATITVKAGGQIQVLSKADIRTQTFTAL
jgi:hypothetical protein